MKKTIMSMSLISMLVTAPVFAGGVAADSAQAANYSGQAALHAGSAGVKSVAGVAALPFKAVGEVGNVVGKAGDAMWDAANKPLEVSKDVYTTLPAPNEMQ